MKRISTWILSFVMILTSVQFMGVSSVGAETITDIVNGDILIDENFQNIAVESLGATVNVGNTDKTSVEISEGPTNANDKALHIHRKAVSGASNTFVCLPIGETVNSGKIIIDMDVYAKTEGIFAGATDDTSWPAGVASKLTPTINPYNNTSASSKGNLSLNSWHDVTFEITLGTLTYDLWIDGNQYADDFKFRTTDAQPNNSIANVLLWLGNSSGTSDTGEREVYIDNLKVSKDNKSYTTIINDSFSDGNITNWVAAENSTTATVNTEGAVGFSADNYSKFDALKTTFADRTDNLILDFDYKIPTSDSRDIAVYFHGKKNGVQTSNLISTVIKYNSVVNYRTIAGTTTSHTICSGIGSAGWKNVKMLLDVNRNFISLWVDDVYVDSFEFRHFPDVSAINSISIGAGSSSAKNGACHIDNIRLYGTNSSDLFEVDECLVNVNFDNEITGSAPSAFVDSSKTTLVGEKTAGSSDKIMVINGDTASDRTVNFTLPQAISMGSVDFTFDFNVPDSSKVYSRFYLQSSSGTTLLSAYLYKNDLKITYATGTDTVVAEDIADGEWHTAKFHVNVGTKKITVTVDETEAATQYDFRNAESVNNVSKGFFGLGYNATSPSTFKIDNFKVNRDITNYNISFDLPEGMSVAPDGEKILGCDFKSSVGTVLNDIVCTPAECSVYVTDYAGNVKGATDIVSPDDKLVIIHAEAGIRQTYKFVSDFEIDFRRATVNNTQYADSSKVTLPGKFKSIVNITNNKYSDETMDVYAAVVGDKLYDVALIKSVIIPSFVTDKVEFELNIPDKAEDVSLKVMLLDGSGTMQPLSMYERKLVTTSQNISMPNIFSDNMVLQRNKPVNIFGFAPTGSQITVKFDGKVKTGYAYGGKFSVILDEMDAKNTGSELVVTVKNGDVTEEFTYSNVVVGDVYYGSGQSNMQMSVGSFSGLAAKLGFVENVRCFDVAAVTTNQGRIDGGDARVDAEAWRELTKDNYTGASVTMYSIAAALRNNNGLSDDVPIGFVKCAWGGTSISKWISADIVADYSSWFKSYLNRTTDNNGIAVSDLYDSMATSIIPYTFKAAVWYQGEADVNVSDYDVIASKMINEMRSGFGYNLPYFIVQLPGYGVYANWDKFRPIQWNIQNLVSDTYVAVTNDTGSATDIHPTDKDIVGDRVARLIMKHLDKVENVAYSGPVYKDSSVDGNTVVVSFDYVNDGVHGNLCNLGSGEIKGFEVSSDGNNWCNASAVINENTIVLTSDVINPSYVRYGWINTPLKGIGTTTTDATGTVQLPLAPFAELIN